MSNKIYPDDNDLKKIADQMRAGKQYVDYDSEYYDGENRTYQFDEKENSFKLIRIDTIALTYMFEDFLSEQELYEYLADISLYRFRESGFEV
jgi:hypothetical protein